MYIAPFFTGYKERPSFMKVPAKCKKLSEIINKQDAENEVQNTKKKACLTGIP